MEIETKKSSIVLNLISVCLSLLGSFLILPFLMKFLSKEVLALWYVFQSIGAIVALLDFGFSPTLARSIVYAWSGSSSIQKEGINEEQTGSRNYALMKKLLSTCRLLYLLISTVGTIIIAIAGTLYINYIAKEVAFNEYIYAWIVYLVAVFSNLFFGYFSVFLRGVGAIDKNSIANIVSRLFQIGITILMLYLNLGLLSATVGYLVNGLIYRFLAQFFFWRHENIKSEILKIEQKVSFKDAFSLFKIIWHNAWRDGVVSLAGYLSGYFITLICSLFISLSETSIYSISSQLILGISSVAAAIYSTYQPSIQSCASKNDNKTSTSLFSFSIISYIFVFVLGFVTLIALGVPIVRLIKEDYVFDLLILSLLAFNELFYKRQSLYCSLISCYNKVPYVWAHLISSTLSVLLMVLLLNVTNLGMYALVIAPIVVNFAFNNWYWPLYAKKTLQTNEKEFVKAGFGEVGKYVSYDGVKKRDSKFELLRIVCVLLIIFYHCGKHFYGNDWNILKTDYSLNFFVTMLFSSWGQVGVSTFVILSSYFLCDKVGISIKKLFYIIFQVFVIDAVVVLVFKLYNIGDVGITTIGLSLLGALYPSNYWFITAFLVFSLLVPFLQIVVKKVSNKNIGWLVLFFTFVIPLYNLIGSSIIGRVGEFCYLFLLTSYFKHKENNFVSNHKVLLLILSTVLIYLISISYNLLISNTTGQIHSFLDAHLFGGIVHILDTGNILIYIASFSLFYCFADSKKSFHSRTVNILAASSLGVYILHENILVRSGAKPFLWDKLLHITDTYSYWFYPFYFIGICFALLIVCGIIEMIRELVIDKIFLNNFTPLQKVLNKCDRIYSIEERFIDNN